MVVDKVEWMEKPQGGGWQGLGPLGSGTSHLRERERVERREKCGMWNELRMLHAQALGFYGLGSLALQVLMELGSLWLG